MMLAIEVFHIILLFMKPFTVNLLSYVDMNAISLEHANTVHKAALPGPVKQHVGYILSVHNNHKTLQFRVTAINTNPSLLVINIIDKAFLCLPVRASGWSSKAECHAFFCVLPLDTSGFWHRSLTFFRYHFVKLMVINVSLRLIEGLVEFCLRYFEKEFGIFKTVLPCVGDIICALVSFSLSFCKICLTYYVVTCNFTFLWYLFVHTWNVVLFIWGFMSSWSWGLGGAHTFMSI